MAKIHLWFSLSKTLLTVANLALCEAISFAKGNIVMRRQRELLKDSTPTYKAGVSIHTADTAGYITDLLSELETIAKLSGLANLSEDIRSVLAKHEVKAFKA